MGDPKLDTARLRELSRLRPILCLLSIAADILAASARIFTRI